jgi:hypothetical protein
MCESVTGRWLRERSLEHVRCTRHPRGAPLPVESPSPSRRKRDSLRGEYTCFVSRDAPYAATSHPSARRPPRQRLRSGREGFADPAADPNSRSAIERATSSGLDSECRSEVSLERRWLHNLRICLGKHSRIGKGLRISTSQSKCSYSRAEVFETIGVLSECDPGFELGWEAGSLSLIEALKH